MDGETGRYFPAVAVANVVDTTAARDAFVGGLATALAQGLPLSEAIGWGSAAGAIAVTRVDAQPLLPTLAELRDLLGGDSPVKYGPLSMPYST